MSRPKMVIVSGFLGAGKTTLLAAAAGRLAQQGLKVGLITNDQAANLVDTALLRQAGSEVKEVAGACFCCAFNRLLYVVDELMTTLSPDVIIGEPVGSCTDLSATVIQPMKKLCRDQFDLAPYTVLADGAELLRSLGSGSTMLESVRYIYRKQLQEADLIAVNKVDALSPQQLREVQSLLADQMPGIPVRLISAAMGQGVDQWLAAMMSGGACGQRIAEVDYDVYAEGEAALGWLNAAVRLGAKAPINWQPLAADLMDRLRTRLAAASAPIAHLKILLTASGSSMKVSLVGNGEPMSQGQPPRGQRATLVVNARVQAEPAQLEAIVRRCIADAAGEAIDAEIAELASFRPGRPAPIHRFDKPL
jgi:Ni2+-binding GTPase involved in maturation of urease and hydrogenase